MNYVWIALFVKYILQYIEEVCVRLYPPRYTFPYFRPMRLDIPYYLLLF